MRPLALAATAAATVAAAACAAPERDPAMASAAAAGSGRACFYAPHARGFSQGPGDSIIVNTGRSKYFVLQPYHRCGNINTRLSVAIRPRGSGYICEGYDADLYVPGVQGYEYCPVRAIRQMSPAEVAAMRASRR